MRKARGLKPGDILAVHLEEGRVVQESVPIEAYTEERITEFLEATRATPEEISVSCKGWGLD